LADCGEIKKKHNETLAQGNSLEKSWKDFQNNFDAAMTNLFSKIGKNIGM
jgi:hypothetical protein